MVKVFVLVEGQTEEKFIKKLLEPHLQQFGVYLVAILLTTKQKMVQILKVVLFLIAKSSKICRNFLMILVQQR
jgi:hypothetical protein